MRLEPIAYKTKHELDYNYVIKVNPVHNKCIYHQDPREPLNKPLSALVYQRNVYLRRGFAGIVGYVKKSQQ